MKKWILLVYFLPVFSFANCPLPHTITYQCHDLNGKPKCVWGPRMGWYQGSGSEDPNLQDGEHAPLHSFEKAIWFPYADDQHGATTCYYRASNGERITLFQQTGYGAVPRPLGSNWQTETSGDFEGGLECVDNTVSCRFDYGERF